MTFALIATLVLFIFERLITEWRRRWIRGVLSDISVEALFRAVADEVITSEEAAEEIIRRYNERVREP